MEKVVHCKKSSYDVYIGRPSIWGNPYAIGRDGTRDEVIAKYREYILGKPELLEQLESLRGKTLACWCSPQACHGDVLVELLNSQDQLCWQDELSMRALEEAMWKKYQAEEIEPVDEPEYIVPWSDAKEGDSLNTEVGQDCSLCMPDSQYKIGTGYSVKGHPTCEFCCRAYDQQEAYAEGESKPLGPADIGKLALEWEERSLLDYRRKEL